MKKTNYFLALALAAAPVTFANAAEGQDAQGQWELTEVAVQQDTQDQHTGNAEFVVTGEDVIVQPNGTNTNNIQVKTPSVISKPHQGDQKDFTNQKFVELWSPKNQYGQANPSGTLAWRNGQDQYEMVATISNAKSAGKKGLTLIAVTGDPQISYRKNDQTITQEEFFEATSKNGKQEVAVWINETGHRPQDNTPSHDTRTNPDQGKNPDQGRNPSGQTN
jgi:hypothetical protein